MPIEIVRRGAAEIGRGNVGFRIRKFRNDELGDLALDVNKMAEDVELMLDAKRQLLLGISHELRSPLSRLRLALELQNNREDQSDLISDLDEMEALGMYEVAPEDFALTEFVCVSKQPHQKIIREGLDLMKKEIG